jgi:hypothetical protein
LDSPALRSSARDARNGTSPPPSGVLLGGLSCPRAGAVFAEAKNNGQPYDGLMLVYLIELDGGATDEDPVDPGAFPPVRT